MGSGALKIAWASASRPARSDSHRTAGRLMPWFSASCTVRGEAMVCRQQVVAMAG